MNAGRVIGRRSALGVIVGGLSGGLAACNFAPSRPPVRGGRLRVAMAASSTADTLDPARQSTAIDYCRGNMFYNGLTRLDELGRAQLDLAEAIETRDACTWTIRLRDGVRFHDGHSLTAADVVWSLRRHTDPALGSKARVFADQFEEVRQVSPDTVRIVLKGPNADLPVILGITQFEILRAGTTRFVTANGTGPFRCVEFSPGIRSVAIRNEDYWRGPVRLGEVDMFSIADDSARINALLADDVDLIASINPRIVRQLSHAGFPILETKTGGYTDLVMRVDRGPGRDADFVAGMKALLDRRTMCSAVFRGFATIANDQPIPPYDPYFNPAVPQRAFDPDRARFYFRRAGILGATIPVVTSPAAEKSDDIAVLLQDAGRRAGLNLVLQRVPADGYWTNSWMKVPVGFGNINARPTADIMFTQFFASTAPWNESGWHDPAFDRMLIEARGSTDEALRRRLYGDMQRRIHDHGGIGIPLFLSTLDAHNPRVKGLEARTTGGLMGFDFAQHVWLEDAA